MHVRRAARRSCARIAALALGVGLLVGGAGTPIATAADQAVAGALTSGDSLFPRQGNGGYDALHYDVDLAVDVATSLVPMAVAATSFSAASTSMRAQTTGAPLSSFGMDFEGPGLTVSSVTVDGVAARFTRDEALTPSDATTDVHKLIVTPATAVSGVFTTVVTYAGTPNAHTDADGSSEGWNNTPDGATFVNEPVGAMTAYPHNNTPADKATYTFTLDIPTRLDTSAIANPGTRHAAAVSNGELLSKERSPDGSRTAWVWDQREQMASDLVLISIGRYDLYADDIVLASGRTLPEWSFLDPSMSAANTASTLETRAQLKPYIDFMETRYGPYPGNSTGLVVDIVPSGINYALETQDRSFFPTNASRVTTIHETMHQWFGDAVSPRDWNDIWLNEGPATYAEAQYLNEGSGTSSTTTETVNYDRWNSTPASSSNWETPPAAMTQAAQLFGWQVYNRGSMTLEALRGSIGDAKFRVVMRQWQDRYAGTSRRTSEFIALAEEISGRDLTAFFQDWLYDADKPSWVQRYTPTISAPATTYPGDTVSLTLQAANVGKIALSSSIATADLADVLDDATLDPDTLPAGVTLEGTTLTWAIPATAVASTATAVIQVVVESDAARGSVLATGLRSTTLGGVCRGGCASSTVVGGDPISPAPAPTIRGRARLGSTLTAVTDGWAEATTFAYRWFADGSAIDGATLPTYTPGVVDVEKAVTVEVTGTQAGHADTTRTSEPVTVARGRQSKQPSPRIKGKAEVGSRIRALAGPHDAGSTLSYRWLVGKKVEASGKKLRLRKAYRGKSVRVRVVARKPGYRPASGTSSKVGPVR